MRICVVGASAVGLVIASRLQLTNFDVCIMSKSRSKNDDRSIHGTIQSALYGVYSFCIPLYNDKTHKEIDIFILATKFNSLDSSIELINRSGLHKVPVLSLLNGVGTKNYLFKNKLNNVIVGNIGKIEAYRDSHDVIVHPSLSLPHIRVANTTTANQNLLDTLHVLLSKCEIILESKIPENEVVWSKLCRLGPIALIGAKYDQTLGETLSKRESKSELEKLVDTYCSIARAESFQIETDEILVSIKQLPSSLKTSFHRDLLVGNVCEIQSLLLEPLKLAVIHNVNSDPLVDILRSLSESYSLQNAHKEYKK
jgi:ketopantoate reductase